jgi:hypothetical protein
MATNGILSRKQLAFMAALMAESSVTKAAEATGIGITTAWRWLRTEAVRQELAERMDAVLAGVCAGLADDAQQARATLRAVMNNPQTPPGVKVRAATAILDAALRNCLKRSLTGQATQHHAGHGDVDHRFTGCFQAFVVLA